MSIVCYLREEVHAKSRGTTEKHVQRNIRTLAKLRERYMAIKEQGQLHAESAHQNVDDD